MPEPKVLNAKDFGVPQNRERIYIVGFHPSTGVNAFEYPIGKAPQTTVASIIEESVVSVKYYLSTQYIDTLGKSTRLTQRKAMALVIKCWVW